MVSKIGHIVRVKDISALSDEFKLLEDRLCAYFAAEEDIAQVIDFPFEKHKLAHQRLLNQFKHTRVELADMNGAWSDAEGEKHCGFLRDRLVQHFKEESAQLKLVLDTQLYDLKPG